MVMAVKSSESENKVYAMTLKRPCKSDPNHEKAWKSGRGEVALVELGIFSTSLVTFSLLFSIH
jgi:hypothetical protein